jgi:SAM-dependent methyltransferase
MQLSQGTEGLEGGELEDVRPLDEGLDGLRAFWDESAHVDALGAVASDDSPETIDESGRSELVGFGEILHPDATVVEIGCGIGRILQHVAPLCEHVTGYDISAGMIKIAAERLAGVPNVSLHMGNGYDLHEVHDDSVDLVYSNFVFQHCPKTIMYNYLVEANRVLRPGGWLWFHVPNLLLDDQFLAFHHFTQPAFAIRPYPMYFFTPSEVATLLLRSGFHVERMNPNIDVWATKGAPGVATEVQDVLVSSGGLLSGWLDDRDRSRRRVDELEQASLIAEDAAAELQSRVNTLERRFPYPQCRRLRQYQFVRRMEASLRGTRTR